MRTVRNWPAAGLVAVLIATGAIGVSDVSAAASARASGPSAEAVVLDGYRLTVEQVVRVARAGAKVNPTGDSLKRADAAYQLLLSGARKGIPIYWFNRNPGQGREEWLFRGDPLSPENKAFISRHQLESFQEGARAGVGPEVADPAIVRAMMVVHLNTILHGGNAASPMLVQMLTALINSDITPVVQSRGSPGLGDLNMMSNVGGALVGLGDVYYQGKRMPAKAALDGAGLKPLEPFGADDAALFSTNAYSVGQMALLLHDAKRVLDWQDLAYAMDMEAMNSSVTPLVSVTQLARPFPEQMWVAHRILNMLRGSYLFELDPKRIVQDPESFRDTSQRNGAAWTAYRRLEQDVLLQINSSDHNPTTAVGALPNDWALDTPWVKQYYIDNPNEVSGFVLSNANFEPIALSNDLESFSIAMAQMAAATAQRPQRLADPFFTVIKASDVLPPDVIAHAAPRSGSYHTSDLISEIQQLANPVPAQGNALEGGVEDLQAFSRQKVSNAGKIVGNLKLLISEELLSNTYWMNVRAAQAPGRRFGEQTTAAWNALRTVIPWQASNRPPEPAVGIVARFIDEHPAETYTGSR